MPKCCCSINNESVNYIGDSEVRDCVTRSIVEVVARAALNRAKQLSGFEEHHFTLGLRRPYFCTPNHTETHTHAFAIDEKAEVWSAAAVKILKYLRFCEKSQLTSFSRLRRNMSFRIVFKMKHRSGCMLWCPFNSLSVKYSCVPK